MASMVNPHLLNPAYKLRMLSGLVIKRSKRMLTQSKSRTMTTTPIVIVDDRPQPPKVDFSALIEKDLPAIPQGGLKHDGEYYKDESESGMCVFRVEDTLFKIHRCYLLREPSAFGDMFSFPNVQGHNEGLSDATPIPLSDSVEQFRDLSWALYAVPTQLCSTDGPTAPSLERLINIAEITNKYCIGSYESWALERLFSMSQDQMGFLRAAPPNLCARVLNIAFLSNHHKLLDIVTQRLIARILWSDVDRKPILDVAESRGLSKLQGVIYYKELVDMERAASDPFNRQAVHPVFPSSLGIEKRMKFLAAHHSLNNLWEYVRMNPPTFNREGCNCHSRCLDTWTQLWMDAGVAQQTLRHGSADVLGRLKSMMIRVKKSMMTSNSMSLGCTLAALEAITTTRDDIVAGLMDHFREFS